MGDYSSFYKYEKFEVVGDELISLGIFSVDADGTMPLVVKDDCDPQCGCPQPIYQWIQTEDTVCIEVITRTTTGTPYCSGDDLYADVTVEESIDDGDTWEVVSTTPTLVEEGGCASPEVQYRWVAIGTTCSNGNKYQNNIKQVSTDGGHTWTDVVPAEYSASTLIESDSYDCGYRTSATTSATYCSNANQYVDVYSLVSRDYGVTWSTASTSTELIEEDVVECGFSARTISTATTCVGVDKHYLDEYQESRDTGTTWTTISSSTGSLIESNSYDCGYRTGTTSGTPYCSGYDKYVDVYYRTSTDGGTTWVTASTTPTLVEAQSEDCGYVPPTPASPKFTLTLSDSSVVSAECDSTSAITTAETSDYHLNIISATIGDCVTTIGDEAFDNCMTLTSVTIPNSVTTIGENAFNGCDLYGISLPGTLINLGDGAFKYCQNLQDVNIPVGYVPNECFSHCPNLKDVDFSFNTTTIDFGAFSSCYSLESIEIPSAIESINYEAFKNCENLASVYVHATTPPTLRNDSFDGTPIADGTGTIYVPSESVNAYKAASGWSTYASQIQAIP